MAPRWPPAGDLGSDLRARLGSAAGHADPRRRRRRSAGAGQPHSHQEAHVNPRRTALTAVAIALASAFFFTCTYVLNRAAAVEGGYWAWTASLRYLITLPLMLPV